MLRRFRDGRDPFWDDGISARNRNHRSRISSALAFALAVMACGLTAAIWLLPFVQAGARLTAH